MTADTFCLLACGGFFFSGLLTGAWKYACMMRALDGLAPPYVDIAHRTSLLYAFACLVLRAFVPTSPLGPAGTFWAVAVPIAFFASAVGLYLLHGMLRDTDNQLRRPHTLGPLPMPRVLIQLYMAALIVGEIGGFGILFYGFLRSL